MEKFLKYILLGIAFILVGIVAAVICIISDSYIPMVLTILMPSVGIVLCIIGVRTNNNNNKK